tara:strand:+ start:496 stop:693 length:198 start_codon:yes stop_codon:yes gene_type:complete
MASTTFSGPVTSTNGFVGAVTATTITASGDSDLLGTANVIVLPTSDPGVAGAVWNNGGAFAISAG